LTRTLRRVGEFASSIASQNVVPMLAIDVSNR
jgi:hypothetical protein